MESKNSKRSSGLPAPEDLAKAAAGKQSTFPLWPDCRCLSVGASRVRDYRRRRKMRPIGFIDEIDVHWYAAVRSWWRTWWNEQTLNQLPFVKWMDGSANEGLVVDCCDNRGRIFRPHIVSGAVWLPRGCRRSSDPVGELLSWKWACKEINRLDLILILISSQKDSPDLGGYQEFIEWSSAVLVARQNRKLFHGDGRSWWKA